MAADDPEVDNLDVEGNEHEADEFSGEDPDNNDTDSGDTPDSIPDDNSEVDAINSYGEGQDENLEIDDLDLSSLEEGNFDDDDDEDEKTGNGKKKKIIIIGGGSFIVIIIIVVGAVFLLGFGNTDENISADGTKLSDAMVIPPKGSLKGRKKLRRQDTKKLTSKDNRKKILRPSENSALTKGSQTKLSRAGNSSSISPPKNTQAPQAPISESTNASSSGNQALLSKPSKQGQTNQAATAPPTTKVVGARIVPGGGLTVPTITADAYRAIPMQPKSDPLPAPRQELMESVEGHILPKIDQSGQKAWQAYAYPYKPEEPKVDENGKIISQKVRVSLLIRGLGLSRNSTLAAINQLPAVVSLVFSPYTRGVEQWAAMARSAGHETLLSLPMEPADFPASDPGPLALMTDLGKKDNIKRLQKIMGMSQAYVGMVQNMGSRFATSEAAFKPVLTYVKERGLLFVDDGLVNNSVGTSIANTLLLPNAKGDLVIDDNASGRQIAANLRKLENIAREKKVALGIGEAFPATVMEISRWVKTLPNKNIELAPITGVVSVPAPKPVEEKEQ